jgi:hypothetical protein
VDPVELDRKFDAAARARREAELKLLAADSLAHAVARLVSDWIKDPATNAEQLRSWLQLSVERYDNAWTTYLAARDQRDRADKEALDEADRSS